MITRDLEGQEVRRKVGERARFYLKRNDERRQDMTRIGREEERERN